MRSVVGLYQWEHYSRGRWKALLWIGRIQDVATIMMSFESQRSGVRSLNAAFVSRPTARLGIDSNPLTDVTDAI